MVYSCDVDEERRLIVVRFRGDVTYDDMTGATADALEGRRSDVRYRALVDFTGVEAWVSTKEVRRLADFHLAWRPAMGLERTALVAREPHIFGDLRVWEMTTGELGFERMVFREEHSAIHWLLTGNLPGGATET